MMMTEYYVKQSVFLLLMFVFFVACEQEEEVFYDRSEETALHTAINWMKLQYPQRESYVVEAVRADAENGSPVNYRFDFAGGGFVIVSADEEDHPILAYSNTGRLSEVEETDSLAGALIRGLKSDAVSEWELQRNQLLWSTINGQSPEALRVLRSSSSPVVKPLIQTTWGQSGGYHPNFTYNKYTPYVTSRDRAPTGCVAVAFGQMLNYYQFPQKGLGYNKYCSSGRSTYNCYDGEIVEVNFYQTEYSWEDMTNKLSYSSSDKQVDAVATLLYHVGASVSAKYGEHGTSAQIENPAIFNGFKRHFKMTEVEKVKKSDYSDEQWAALIKTELVEERPVVLFGEDANIGAGHAYIVDGIDINGYVHVNWGWNGAANGYFLLNSLVIDGKYSFTDGLSAYINFVPPMKQMERSFRYTLQPGQWIDVAEIDTVEGLEVEMNFDGPWRGDGDLYVKKGSRPSTDDFDCAPLRGSSIETCTLKGRGKYYIAVHGYDEHGQTSESPINLQVTYREYDE